MATRNAKSANRIGEKLRTLRESRGMNQTEFAEKLGKNQSQICEWENGKYQPQLSTLIEIAAKLKVELSVLLPG